MGTDVKSVIEAMISNAICVRNLYDDQNSMTVESNLISQLRGKVRKYYLHVWLMKGKEQHSSNDLMILYAGHLLNKNYISYLAYGDEHSDVHLGKAWAWNVTRYVKDYPDIALIFTETTEGYFNRFGARDDYYIPCWLDGEIEFSRYHELVKCSDNLKSDIRKIRKQGYTYEISRDKDKFDLFYYSMYRPYILKVHGNRAALMSYDAMMNAYGITELLLIKQGGNYIAGENLLYEGKSVRAWSLGVVDGETQHVKNGVIGALYYYKIGYLQGRGYRKFNAGASRPFLKDGVIRYKRKWGLSLTCPRPGGWWLRYDPAHPSAQAFISVNPFIYYREREMRSYFSADMSRDSTHDELSGGWAKYSIPGLKNNT